MSMVALDTLATARTLEAVGFAKDQAEAIANAVRDAVTENVAAKADVERVETGIERVKADVERVKADIARLSDDVARLSVRMDALTLRFAVVGIGLVGVAVAAMKLL